MSSETLRYALDGVIIAVLLATAGTLLWRHWLERTHDHLTGLYNRRALYDHLDGLLRRAIRGGQGVSVLLIDLDNFKSINDVYGHLVGDQALQLVAAVLEENTRFSDRVGRWAGDEFLVILPGTTAEQARQAADRLLAQINATTLPLPGAGSAPLQASIGVANTAVAIRHSVPLAIDPLVRWVDGALYQAKAAGRNRVCLAGDAS